MADDSVVLVHSSDIHVDDEARPAPASGLDGLRAVLAIAGRLGAQVVLLAGDTFDNARVSQKVLDQATAILAGAAMPVVMLPGNHDPAMEDCLFRRAGLTALGHVHILGVTHGDTVRFDAWDLEIRGRAHVSYNDMPPLPRWTREARFQVVMAHGHYVPQADWKQHAHRAWKISDADIAACEADYIALGHWDRATPAGEGRVAAYYSGSPDLAGTVNVVRLGGVDGVVVERVGLA